MGGLIPKYMTFRVAGTFHSGFYQYDAEMGFLRLGDAQRLFDEPDLLSVISFKVDNLNHAPEIARDIEQAAGSGLHDDQLDRSESRAVSRSQSSSRWSRSS